MKIDDLKLFEETYLFTPSGGRMEVLKTDAKGTKKYVIFPDETCSCPGFQNRGHCKHVEMMKGEYHLEALETDANLELVKAVYGWFLQSFAQKPPIEDISILPSTLEKVSFTLHKQTKSLWTKFLGVATLNGKKLVVEVNVERK